MTWSDSAAQSDLVIAHLNSSYAEAIAQIHAEALSGDVLPALGPRFLTRYYRYVIQTPSQVVIGAILNKELVGFCQMSFSPVGILDVLRADPLAVFHIAKLKIRVFLTGLGLALFRPGEVYSKPEISFIAVHPNFQGGGVGKMMVREINKIARTRGASSVTTKTSNKIARVMYEKSFGARVVATKSVLRRKFWYLSWDIASQ